MWNSGNFYFVPFHEKKHSRSFKALNYYYLCLVSDIGGNKLNLFVVFTIKTPQADPESKKCEKQSTANRILTVAY